MKTFKLTWAVLVAALVIVLALAGVSVGAETLGVVNAIDDE